MRLALLLFLAVLAFANENDDLAREFEQWHQDAQKVLKQIEDHTKKLDGSRLGEARAKAMRLAADDRFLQSVTELWNHPKRNTLFVAEGRCHRPNHDDLVHTAAPREATADLDVHASAPPSTRDRNDSGRSRSALSTPAQISA